MKVFLDTNVLVSAISTRGLCADVFRIVLTEHDLIVSEALMAEVERVLLEKLDLPTEIVRSFLEFILQDSTFSKSSGLTEIELQDQTDIPILSSAKFSGSEVFITGDKELLNLVRIDDMMILSPRLFWEMLATSNRSSLDRAGG